MARIYKNWDGTWSGDKDFYDAIAASNRRMAEDAAWNRHVADMPASFARDLGRDLVTTTVTTTAVGVGMFFNERFRYIVQAILHLPMSFIVTLMIALAILGSDTLAPLVWAFWVSIGWTALYIACRTIPKWRAL